MSSDGVLVKRRILYALAGGLTVSLAGAGILGYFVWDLHSRFSKAEESLDARLAEAERSLDVKLADAEEEVTAIAEEALARVPDVAQLQEKVDTLEQTLFGVLGAPPFAVDVLGDMERDIREVSELKLCVNSGFSTLQANVDRVENYVAALAAGLIAIRPTTFAPRC